MTNERPRSWSELPRGGKAFWVIVAVVLFLILLSFTIWPDGSFPVHLRGL